MSLAALNRRVFFVLSRLMLLLTSVCVMLMLATVFFSAFPQYLPADARTPDQNRRIYANTSNQFVIDTEEGDLLRLMGGKIRPIEANEVYAEFDWVADRNGFRVPAMTSDAYPIVALGDSFTAGSVVATPWTDYLASELETPVFNLSFSGYGTRHQAQTFADYRPNDPDWVLIAYFEGNDLREVKPEPVYLGIHLQILSNYVSHLVNQPSSTAGTGNANDGVGTERLYPVSVNVDAHEYPLVFYEPYLWMTNVSEETLRASQNLQEFEGQLERIIELADDACVALIYLPTKGHVFWPFVEPQDQDRILDDMRVMRLQGGWLEPGPLTPTSPEDFLSRLDNQKNVVESIVTSSDVLFLDLTPELRAAAMQGSQVFYTYDTHWDDSGHQAASRVIADFIRAQNGC